MVMKVPGADNSVLTLARACADTWPYEPKYLAATLHPSRVFVLDSDYMQVPDVRSRTLVVSVRALKKAAEVVLRGRNVQHFEVQVVIVYPGGSHTGHTMDGCEVCDWLQYSDMTEGFLIGWQAVLKERGNV